MSAAARLAPLRWAGTAWAVLLIAVALFTGHYAVQLLRFDQLDRALAAQSTGAVWKGGDAAPVTTLREEIGPWRDMPGVREKARKDYVTSGKMLAVPADTFLLDAADLLRIDPVNGWAWVDLARAAAFAKMPVAVVSDALQMSAISAPREYSAIVGRAILIVDLWDELSDERRRILLADMNLLSRMWSGRGNLNNVNWWREALQRQPEARRREIQEAYKAYDSTYEMLTF